MQHSVIFHVMALQHDDQEWYGSLCLAQEVGMVWICSTASRETLSGPTSGGAAGRALRSRSVIMKSTRSWSRNGSGPSAVSAPSPVQTGQLVLWHRKVLNCQSRLGSLCAHQQQQLL